MTRHESRLNLVVALSAEAKAINRILDLQRVMSDSGFSLYTRDDVSLIVTGPGMEAVQMGVGYLQQRNKTARPDWLNIGIAGHADLPLGQAVTASRVIGPTPGYCRDLHPLALPRCLSMPICTVPQPETDYPKPWAYDMEAAGFVAAALETSPLSRIQVLKIISDNRRHPSRSINAKMVKALLMQHAELIRQLVVRMNDHALTSNP